MIFRIGMTGAEPLWKTGRAALVKLASRTVTQRIPGQINKENSLRMNSRFITFSDVMVNGIVFY